MNSHTTRLAFVERPGFVKCRRRARIKWSAVVLHLQDDAPRLQIDGHANLIRHRADSMIDQIEDQLFQYETNLEARGIRQAILGAKALHLVGDNRVIAGVSRGAIATSSDIIWPSTSKSAENRSAVQRLLADDRQYS